MSNYPASKRTDITQKPLKGKRRRQSFTSTSKMTDIGGGAAKSDLTQKFSVT